MARSDVRLTCMFDVIHDQSLRCAVCEYAYGATPFQLAIADLIQKGGSTETILVDLRRILTREAARRLILAAVQEVVNETNSGKEVR